jgi:hypothetical protein
MKGRSEAIAGGNMNEVEAMLYAQATTLQNLFTNLGKGGA